MIDFLTAAALIGQGVNILGSMRQMKSVETQERLQKMAADTNAESQRTAVMSKYTDIFSQQASDIATQSATFANAGIDRAGSLFRQGMRSHEKNFLDTKANMSDDITTINNNLAVQKANIGMEAVNQKKQLQSNIVSGLANAFMSYATYKTAKGTELNNISGGKKAGSTFKEIPKNQWLG